MKCHDCENQGRNPLIIDMRRVTLCDECHAKRIKPRGIRAVSELQMVADLRSGELAPNEAALLAVYTENSASAYHWDLALVRTSLRAIWIERAELERNRKG